MAIFRSHSQAAYFEPSADGYYYLVVREGNPPGGGTEPSPAIGHYHVIVEDMGPAKRTAGGVLRSARSLLYPPSRPE